jgi:RNA polymerase sigma-70 factor, ECF subfamily
MESAEEQRLVQGLVRMEEAAWERFCHLYASGLLQFVRHALRVEHERAEDVVQLTLLRCIRSIGTFDPKRSDLLTWLKAIARNEAHSLGRREVSGIIEIPHSAFPEPVLDQILQQMDTELLPDAVLARRDVQNLVREALAAMNERQREVLLLKYAEDLRVAEIAARLAVTEKTVESLLTRARESFRRLFAEKTAHPSSLREVEMP